MTRNEMYNKLPAGTVNKQGFVVNGKTPFLSSKDAIDWALRMETEDVRYDPVLCRQLAIAQRPGVEHIFVVTEMKREDIVEKIKRKSEELDATPDSDIMDTVNKALIRRKMAELVGRHSELCDETILLRNREYELYRCARIEVNDK